MRRFALLSALFVLGALAAMAATFSTPLGTPLWHYHVALAAVLLAGIPLWSVLKSRRVATLGMAYAGALATATGFVMLYTRELPGKERLTWWHSVTSFAFLGLFLAHWWNNQQRLMQFTRRLLQGAPEGRIAGGAWTAGVAMGALTWTPDLRGHFARDNYLLLASWTLWIGVTLTWGIWLWHRRDAWRARLHDADGRYRNKARALVDTSLFLACWLALLTGFALLYFAPWFEKTGLKYVSKWWHTATSVLFLALVALHIGFNARLLRAHAARIDDDLSTR